MLEGVFVVFAARPIITIALLHHGGFLPFSAGFFLGEFSVGYFFFKHGFGGRLCGGTTID